MSGVGHLELLLWANGNSNTDEQSLSIQIALHHPFSQGRVYINSSDPFDDPIIDPQYFSHFADLISLREGIKLVRKIGQSPPMKDVLPEELSPGPGVTSDQDIEAFLLNDVESQYHPGNTLAMLPRNSGGVVDAKLKVYGLGNVRVVDSSVFPLSLAAHVRLLSPSMFFPFSDALLQLQAPVYALAEHASDIIRDDWKQGSASNGSNPRHACFLLAFTVALAAILSL